MHFEIKIQRVQEVVEENKGCVSLHDGNGKTFYAEIKVNLFLKLQ